MSETAEASFDFDEDRRPLGFRRLIPYVKRHRARLILGLILSPVYSGLALYIPWIFRDILKNLQKLAPLGGTGAAAVESAGVEPDYWRNTVLFLILLGFLHASIRYGVRFLLVGLSRHVEAELRHDLFAHLSRLPIRFFDQARIGDLISRATQDIELLRFMAGPTLFFGSSLLLILPGSLTLIFSLSVPFGITVVCLLTVVAFLLTRVFPLLSQRSRVVQDAQADISAHAQESFTGIRVLQAFAREASQVGSFRKEIDKCLDAQVEMAKARGLIHATIIISASLSLLAVISVGVMTGMDVADLFTAVVYLGTLTMPLMILGWIMQTYHRAKAAADRIDEVFVVSPEPGPEPGVKIPSSLEPSIEARKLSFRYSSSAPHALKDVSFELKPRQCLGLVGPVGAGKTTLISLLARFYDPPKGTLFFGGVDVLELPQNELRGQLSVALQEPFLFGDSIRNNILFGAGDETVSLEERTDKAVESSHLIQDLDAFEDGVDQLVGERGVTLSGGQKQRASLARALMGDRQVLILDDTLSAVDHETERSILEHLAEHREERTTIVVAHRLEAVKDADLILVLDEGTVIEQGTHEALLAHGGWYARTWAQQSEEQDA